MTVRAWPYPACAAAISGALAATAVPAGPGVEALVFSGMAGIGAAIVRGPWRLALVSVCVGALALTMGMRARHGLEVSPLTSSIERRAPVLVRARLVSDPVPGPFTTQAVIRVDSFREPHETAWRGGRGRHVLAVAGRDTASPLIVLEAGDRITVEGTLRALTPYDRRRRDRHVVGRLSVRDVTDAARPTDALLRVANVLRSLVLRGGEGLPPTTRGLLSGFLVGDTRGIPDDVHDDFRDSGLSHLLAVSGSNVAFVLALVAPVLNRGSLRFRLSGGVLVVLVFATMTRFEPSVLRAASMATMGMVAAFVGRRALGLRLLSLSVIGLVLVDPFLVHSVAFRLSCAASLGILVGAAPLTRRLRGPRVLRETIGTTAAAQIGVAPVLVPVFGGMPLAALPANALAVPLAGPLTVWGMLTGAIGGLIEPWIPELARLLQVPTDLMVSAVAQTAAVAARLPMHIDGPSAWAIVAVGSFVAGFRRWSRRLDLDDADRAPRGRHP